MFVIPSEFTASTWDLPTFKNKQFGFCSPILFDFIFFPLFNCQIRSDSVEADFSEGSVCSSLTVFCLLYFASLGSPLLLWPGFLPFNL